MLRLINEMNSVETYGYCPKCGNRFDFIGVNVPIVCVKCFLVFPDFLDIQYDATERAKFHLREGFSYQCL